MFEVLQSCQVNQHAVEWWMSQILYINILLMHCFQTIFHKTNFLNYKPILLLLLIFQQTQMFRRLSTCVTCKLVPPYCQVFSYNLEKCRYKAQCDVLLTQLLCFEVSELPKLERLRTINHVNFSEVKNYTHSLRFQYLNAPPKFF